MSDPVSSSLPNLPLGEGETSTHQSASLPISKTELLFSLLCLVLGYIYLRLIVLSRPGVGITLFALAFLAVFFVYLKKQKINLPKESWIYFTLAFLSAINFALFANRHLAGYQFLFLTCVSLYWLLSAAGARYEGKLGNYLWLDGLRGFIVIPFSHFAMAAKSIAHYSKKRRRLLTVLLGALIAAPVLYGVIGLLMRADPIFEYLMHSIGMAFSDNIARTLTQIVISLPIGCYLFGLLYGATHPKEAVRPLSVKIPDVPAAVVITMLSLLAGVYLLFFVTQFISILRVLQGSTDDFSYAQYARRGFFELCQIAFINLLLFIGVRILEKKRSRRPVFFLLFLLGCETLLIIASAAFKMGLYIQVYGLTLLRVHTFWFMSVLFLVFIILIVSLFKKSMNPVRSSVLIASVAFLILSYSNVGGIIAHYNISRYLSGTLYTMEVFDFGPIGSEAAPYLIDLYKKTEDSTLKQSVALFLHNSLAKVKSDDSAFDWAGYSLQQLWSRHEISAFFASHPDILLPTAFGK